MWIFTTLGFYSAVCARKGDGRHSNPVDPDRIMVRARDRQHLDNLIDFGGLDVEIHESNHTDYACRIFLDKVLWAELLAQLVLVEVDYDNFKDAVSRRKATKPSYKDVLGGVWSRTMALQRRGPSRDLGRLFDDPEPRDEPVLERVDIPKDETVYVLRRGSVPRGKKRVLAILRASGREAAMRLADAALRDTFSESVLAPRLRYLEALDLDLGGADEFVVTPHVWREIAGWAASSGVTVYEDEPEAVLIEVESTPAVAPPNLNGTSPMHDEKKNVIGADLRASAEPAKATNVPPAKPGPLVEDTSVAGGTDEHGAPVIAPKDQEGHLAENLRATDPRENS